MATKAQKPSKIRHFLKIVVVVCVCAAVILAMRAYFLENPPTGTALTSDKVQLGTNSPTSLEGVNTELNGAVTAVWGEGITDTYSLPATTGVWLKLVDNQNTYIGELKDDKFQLLYTLPLSASGIHMYANKAVLYFTPSTNTADAELVGIEGTKTTRLLRLDPGWEFHSVYFDPMYKQFYMNVYDRTGQSRIQVLRQNNMIQEIADTSQYFKPQILDVDTVNQQLIFKTESAGQPACVSLSLINKSTYNKDCAGVRVNSINLIATTNQPSLPLSTDFKGTILLTNTANGNQQFIRTGEAGDVYSLPSVNAQNVAVLYSRIKTSGTALVIEPQSIQIFDLVSRNLVHEIKQLPLGIQTLIMTSQNRIYVTDKDIDDVVTLWQEPQNGDTDWKKVTIAVCTQNCVYTAL